MLQRGNSFCLFSSLKISLSLFLSRVNGFLIPNVSPMRRALHPVRLSLSTNHTQGIAVYYCKSLAL